MKGISPSASPAAVAFPLPPPPRLGGNFSPTGGGSHTSSSPANTLLGSRRSSFSFPRNPAAPSPSSATPTPSLGPFIPISVEPLLEVEDKEESLSSHALPEAAAESGDADASLSGSHDGHGQPLVAKPHPHPHHHHHHHHHEQQHGSLTTILSLANTMLGSSLYCTIWGWFISGFLGGFIATVVMGLMCFYTANLIVRHGYKYHDFSDLCYEHLGRPGRFLAWVGSIFVIIGALAAYTVLMGDATFSIVSGLAELARGGGGSDSGASAAVAAAAGVENGHGGWWNPRTCSVLIVLALFPITNIRDTGTFVRMNAYGSISVMYIFLFILLQCLHEGLSFKHVGDVHIETTHFAPVLMLSFFIHNAAVPVFRSKGGDPRHNTRDLGFAFLIVGVAYSVIGAVGFLAYHRRHQFAAHGFPQDFLTIFSDTDIGAMLARLFLVMQLFTVFPLLAYIMRLQFFGFVFGTRTPARAPMAALNAVACLFCGALAGLGISIGDIFRVLGSTIGVVYIFFLPIAVHLIKQFQIRSFAPSAPPPSLAHAPAFKPAEAPQSAASSSSSSSSSSSGSSASSSSCSSAQGDGSDAPDAKSRAARTPSRSLLRVNVNVGASQAHEGAGVFGPAAAAAATDAAESAPLLATAAAEPGAASAAPADAASKQPGQGRYGATASASASNASAAAPDAAVPSLSRSSSCASEPPDEQQQGQQGQQGQGQDQSACGCAPWCGVAGSLAFHGLFILGGCALLAFQFFF